VQKVVGGLIGGAFLHVAVSEGVKCCLRFSGFFAVKPWVMESGFYSDFCHEAVAPEHMELMLVYLLLCLGGGQAGWALHRACGVCVGENIDGMVNFIKKIRGFFNCRYRKTNSCICLKAVW